MNSHSNFVFCVVEIDDVLYQKLGQPLLVDIVAPARSMPMEDHLRVSGSDPDPLVAETLPDRSSTRVAARVQQHTQEHVPTGFKLAAMGRLVGETLRIGDATDAS